MNDPQDANSHETALRKIRNSALLLFGLASALVVVLVLFGDEQLGEPHVTRSDVPALLALLVPTFAAVITGFVLAVRLSTYDDEFGNSDDGATASALTWARHGLVLLLILMLWPDRLNPLPAHIAEKSIAVVGGGAALIGGLVALAARSLLQGGKPTD